MRPSLILLGLLAAAVAASRCGGGGSSQTPTTPAPSTVTVNIVGILGNKSYSPNPVSAPSGALLTFRNTDTNAHRIVMDDGSADLGLLAPGASSQARTLNNGKFHCTNHPSMVGSINTETAPEPPPGSGDGY